MLGDCLLEFLVTTTNGWGIFRDGKYTQLDQCAVGYYGVTWDEKFIYAAKKHNNSPKNINAQTSTQRSWCTIESLS